MNNKPGTLTAAVMKEFEAICFKCHRVTTVISGTYSGAKSIIRSDGWRLRNSVWICPICAGTGASLSATDVVEDARRE